MVGDYEGAGVHAADANGGGVNYYNENDPKAAAWLRQLIAAELIPAGHVDERSICDVQPQDLDGYTQCHFFAGIAGWSRALQLAGWPLERRIWTGSCPCQPWSNANVWEGGGKGSTDDRHLWPDFFRLIQESRPATVTGEQVPGAIAKGWLDEVFSDLESAGYACGSVVLPANAFGAAHERERLYWVAYAGSEGRERHQPVKRLPVTTQASLAINGDPLAGARRALEGDYSDLLPCDGLSVQLERSAIKGYGNAIVPVVAAEFIQAFLEVDAA
jgi:DNA (cytosine-5)-methyltransferase 1